LPQFFFERRARFQHRAEVVFAQRVEHARLACDQCRISTFVGDQRRLAEVLAFLQHGHLALLRAVVDQHVDAARADEIEQVAFVPLADHHLALVGLVDHHLVGHLGERVRREVGEQREVFEEIADDGRFLDRDVRLDVALDHVDDAVGDVEDAVVVRDDDDRAAFVAGEFLKERHHFAARFFVERGRRFVGEDQLRFVDQPAGDGHALLLPAGERFGFVVDAVPKPEPREQRSDPAFGDHGIEAHEFRGHVDVLIGGERLEQVVGLEDEPHFLSQPHDEIAVGAVEFVPEDAQAPFLNRAERADEREERRFPRARRAGHDHDFAAADFEVVLEQGLLAELAFAEVVVEARDLHGARHLHRAREGAAGCRDGGLRGHGGVFKL
jgi:hypothetical protein